MGYMEERRSPQTIFIPQWMNTAVSELAIMHNRDMNSEIELLVKAAMKREAGAGNRPNSAAALSRAGQQTGKKA
jgi:hypothetical protein